MKAASLIILIGCLLIAGVTFNSFKKAKRFSIIENKAGKRVDITIDGKPFTSYIYPDELMKPVLYPLRTSKGTLITRGWPMDPRAGERVDHPHHVGMWFNYGNVNGLDFWNNSTAIAADKKNGYGTIKHVSVNKTLATDDKAELDVTMYWQKPDGTNLVKEDTKYIFTGTGEQRAIELNTTLTALKEDVSFMDNKEGLLGIRLARELEHPSNKPEQFTDANGIATSVAKLNNEGVTGKYRSSEGIEGDNVWATRGRWVNLNGKI
ncbi:MAG TPA: PmoA family protein, partial [Flavitalea sp.]|nr:PmoA family protein [Flavitalea sp.]